MSKREWKPGDVAMVNDCTRLDAPWKVALCIASAVPGVTETRWRIDTGEVWSSVSDARPLVVIDPEDNAATLRLAEIFLACTTLRKPTPATVADTLKEALREFANPKPEEPIGLGAVVEDANGVRHVRTFAGSALTVWLGHIQGDGGERTRRWADIAPVKVLSEGVTE